MSLRTVLVSDTFAYAFLERRPYPSWEPYWKGYRDRAIVTPEYGLLYIAAMLKDQGIPYDLVNIVADHWTDMRWFEVSDDHQHDEKARAEFEGLLATMKEDLLARVAGADVVMVPMSYYYMVRGVKRAITAMREAAPNALFVVGGNYATMHAFELILDGFADIVVRGEGEDTIVQLMAELESGAWRSSGKLQTLGLSYQLPGGEPAHNMDMPRINDLDRLPHMYFAGDDFKVGMRHLFLKTLQPDGDYFIGSSYNVQTRADMIDEETLIKMKAASFGNLAFGSESFNDEILENVVLKRQTSKAVLDGALLARRLEMDPILTFIAGLPGETKESHLRTVQILRENGFTEATFFPLVVFRGTPLYDQFVAGKSPEEIEKARFDEDSEEFCCLSEDFPTKEALIAWASYLNSEIRKGALETVDDMSGSDVGHLLAG